MSRLAAPWPRAKKLSPPEARNELATTRYDRGGVDVDAVQRHPEDARARRGGRVVRVLERPSRCRASGTVAGAPAGCHCCSSTCRIWAPVRLQGDEGVRERLDFGGLLIGEHARSGCRRHVGAKPARVHERRSASPGSARSADHSCASATKLPSVDSPPRFSAPDASFARLKSAVDRAERPHGSFGCRDRLRLGDRSPWRGSGRRPARCTEAPAPWPGRHHGCTTCRVVSHRRAPSWCPDRPGSACC